jgi:hypothetical protein
MYFYRIQRWHPSYHLRGHVGFLNKNDRPCTYYLQTTTGGKIMSKSSLLKGTDADPFKTTNQTFSEEDAETAAILFYIPF